jgi:hypothetical protein
MQKKENQFLKIPYKLLGAVGYVNKDGECVKMTLTEKIIYAHLRNRFVFFRSLNKEYYDTQQAIADACNMDIKSVGNILRKFIKSELTTVYKKRFNGFPKNVYTNVPELLLYQKDNTIEQNDEPEIDVEDFEGEHWVDDFDYGDLPDWAK